jgi:hypothetical protein
LEGRQIELFQESLSWVVLLSNKRRRPCCAERQDAEVNPHLAVLRARLSDPKGDAVALQALEQYIAELGARVPVAWFRQAPVSWDFPHGAKTDFVEILSAAVLVEESRIRISREKDGWIPLYTGDL